MDSEGGSPKRRNAHRDRPVRTHSDAAAARGGNRPKTAPRSCTRGTADKHRGERIGNKTQTRVDNRIFIEHGRHHGRKIVKHLTERREAAAAVDTGMKAPSGGS